MSPQRELVCEDEKTLVQTYRLAVPGGWIYRTTRVPSIMYGAESAVFVPKPQTSRFDPEQYEPIA